MGRTTMKPKQTLSGNSGSVTNKINDYKKTSRLSKVQKYILRFFHSNPGRRFNELNNSTGSVGHNKLRKQLRELRDRDLVLRTERKGYILKDKAYNQFEEVINQ